MVTPEQLQFSQAIRPHLTRLDRYVAARVDNQYVADICSDVIALAWQKRATIQPTSGSQESGKSQIEADHLLGFLLTTARFQIKNLERKVGNAHRLQPKLIKVGDVPSPEDNALASIAISVAFKSLKARDQELLAMVAWDGFSISQIARFLGITENNAGVRLNRARARFRSALQKENVSLEQNRKNTLSQDIA